MDTRSISMGFLFSLIWSSAFTSAKIVVEFSPPLLTLGVRFIISGCIGLLIVWLLRYPVRLKLNKLEWASLACFGICQNSIYLGLNFIAMQNIDASVAVIIASLLPLFVAMISSIFNLEVLSRLSVFGLVLGVTGVTSIMLIKIESRSDMIGVLLCILAVLALAVATLIAKHSLIKNDNTLTMVSIQMLIGSVPLLITSTIFEEWTINWSTKLMLAFSYTTLVPGLLATFIWFKLVDRVGATKSAAFHFLNPVLGVIIASIILSEKISNNEILGILVVMIAIIMIQLSRIKV